ncbi:MAG: DNA-binding response regulator [Mitsuaria chitosanitabida]|uniref:response regulator transcription factor n=1 Tax=Roseateles chitosanitabidus TaxID=65048 RepID=UPI001B09D923|nr:DNA-binding response regulator [Roseateles chitosanitabidus]MBO9688005.1 DNA-binding response regulator [Roseateles chitosanitabidus]
MSRAASAPAVHRPLLLLVDDQPEELRWLTALLHPLYRLAFAESGRVALQKAQGLAPDLALLDVGLPDMDGFALCRLLKSDPATREMPLLFLSAHNDVGSRIEGLSHGAVDFITKPFHPEEVLARVRVHLRLATPRAASASQEVATTEPEESGTPDQRLLAAARRYIGEHLGEPLTVNQIGRQVGLTGRRLLALFREELGQTVSGYISDERVRTGQRLLADTDMSVADVAYHVGYSNAGNFATAFRERNGLSPQAYRSATRARDREDLGDAEAHAQADADADADADARGDGHRARDADGPVA